MDGGALVGQGAYGCVFNPSIPCEGYKHTSSDINRSSKLLIGQKYKHEYKDELSINMKVRSIKNHNEWAYTWDKYCIPPSYNKIKSLDNQ